MLNFFVFFSLKTNVVIENYEHSPLCSVSELIWYPIQLLNEQDQTAPVWPPVLLVYEAI